MKTNAYDALLEERRVDPGEIARRRDAERLAEIARNLESLGKLAEIEARERELQASPIDPDVNTEVVTREVTAGGDSA